MVLCASPKPAPSSIISSIDTARNWSHMMSFPLEAAASRGGLNASRPNLMSFLARMHARPAYQRALIRGGPYAFAR
jgi:hypothetical protein